MTPRLAVLRRISLMLLAHVALGAALTVTVCLSLLTGCAGSAKWGMVELPPSLAGSVQEVPDGASRSSLHVSTAVRTPPSGVTRVPFRLDDKRQIIVRAHAVGPFQPARDTTDLDLEVDTGAPFVLSLSYEAGMAVRPWLRPSSRTWYSPMGSRRKYSGAILELKVGDASLGPVPVQMDREKGSGRPLLGLAFLRSFDGVIFDWRRREMLLLRGECQAAIAARFPDTIEWCEVPLLNVSQVIERVPFPSGDGEAPQPVPLDLIAVDAKVGDQHVVAVIDTGGSGDALTMRDDLPMIEGTESHRTAGTKEEPVLFMESALAELLVIGDRRFDEVRIFRFAAYHADAPSEVPDLFLGNGLLRRCTLWIDFKRNVVRFGPMDEPTDPGEEQCQTSASM